MKFIPEEFEIPFYKISCSDWKLKKEKFKLVIEGCKQNFELQDVGLGELNTTFFTTLNFKDEITNILEEEIKIFKEQSSLNVNPTHAWFQVYNHGQEHPIHNHGLGYSCVVFINFFKNLHKPTCFLPPFHDYLGQYSYFLPDVIEGDVLFFPSMIPHYAPSNKSQISRIIASINFDIIVEKNETSYSIDFVDTLGYYK